jgi:hypothetical protein
MLPTCRPPAQLAPGPDSSATAQEVGPRRHPTPGGLRTPPDALEIRILANKTRTLYMEAIIGMLTGADD